MKRLPKILAATCAAVALSSSLALAADATSAPASGYGPHHGLHARAAHAMGPMMGPLAQLSPEKQQAAFKLMEENRAALFPLHQAMYAKYAELEAINASGDGDGSKAKAAIRDIADLNAKMLTENSKFRAKMFKATGLRVPVMGHGMMGGMGMMGGKGCGMMAGKGHGMGPGMGMMGGMNLPGGSPISAPADDVDAEHAVQDGADK
jgi:Spy/CpxP family protein refolding chaperone